MGGFFMAYFKEKMTSLLESQPITLGEYPEAIAEHTEGASVGRIILTERTMGTWSPDATFLRFYTALNSKNSDSIEYRRKTTFSLNNNSPCTIEPITHERALSAYFTYNPTEQTVILEWGMINPTGDSKLHTFLNRAVNYPARAAQGMQLSSGHLARVTGTETYLAYMDRLSIDNQFAPNEPMARIINTLHSYGFIPITSEGFVQIPFF
jgi:hypothetical protein